MFGCFVCIRFGKASNTPINLLNLELQINASPSRKPKNLYTKPRPPNADKKTSPKPIQKKHTPGDSSTNPSCGLASRPRRLALRVPRPEPRRREGALRLLKASKGGGSRFNACGWQLGWADNQQAGSVAFFRDSKSGPPVEGSLSLLSGKLRVSW